MEEKSLMVEKAERDLLNVREELSKERKAFLKNLKLRDEQEKIRQQLKVMLSLQICKQHTKVEYI